MEPQALRQWINDHRYTVGRLSRALEVDRSTVHRYLNGTTPIPKTLELALEALANR
jgi:predicted transcriptional regulator